MATKKPTKDTRDVHDVFLWADLGVEMRVGTMYRETARLDLPASFAYDTDWLKSGNCFMLDPRLALWAGEQHPEVDMPAFGVFMDSAPDRWGRVLLERREAALAEREGRKMRQLHEVDFLLGVHDLTRMGALRFRKGTDGPFLDNHPHAAPPVTSLGELAHISRRIEEPGVEKLPEYEKWLAMLIAPGSSLGGARPKANFTDTDGGLWFAKFPASDDRYDVGAWEFVAHTLAARAGIDVPQARLAQLGERHHTFCVKRFDRAGTRRKMFASAMTLLERRDGQPGGSYLDLVGFLEDQGAQHHINADLEQLFRRAVFNVLIGNRDDHLRNHGFIRELTGWRLSPAYDVNPNPGKASHALTLDGHNAEPSLEVVVSSADMYRLGAARVTAIVNEVRYALTSWRDEARSHDLSRLEIQRMEAVIQA
ncbi:MAG: HipA domain-containing protein [Pseudomonadota bacterium]